MAAIPKGVLESAFNLEDRAHDDALVSDLAERVAEQQRVNTPTPPTPQWSLPSLDALLGGGTQTQAPQQPQQQAVPTQPAPMPGQEQRTQGWQLPSLDVLLGRDPNARPAQMAQQQAPLAASGMPAAMPVASDPEGQRMPTSERAANLPQSGGEYRAYARQVAQAYGLDPDIFERQINQESGFQQWGPDGRPLGSSAGAQGIAQFMPGTAASYGVDVNDPYSSLEGAARHMRDLLRANNGNYRMALAAYNAGQGNVDKYGEGVFGDDFANGETKRYVQNILGGGAPVMPRLSLNAAPSSAPDGAAPPAPGGVSSAPPGAPPAPWEQAEAQGDLMLKENDGEDVGSFPTSARQIGNTGADSNLLPGDGGTPPTPEYDPRAYDEGPREYRPPAPAYADPTATDPVYSAPRQPDPIMGPEQPEQTLESTVVDALAGPARAAAEAAREAYNDPFFAAAPQPPRWVKIVSDAMQAFGGRVARQVAELLGVTDEEWFSVFGYPISRLDVAEFAGGVAADPTNYVGLNLADPLLTVARGAARDFVPDAIQQGARAAGSTLREGAEALGRGLQGVGREVAGGLLDLQPGLTPRVIGDGGPGIGRAMAEGATAAPERPVYSPEPPAGVQRRYHGTAGAFERPDPARFDENGLYGPGYYTTSDPRVAGGFADRPDGIGYAWQRGQGFRPGQEADVERLIANRATSQDIVDRLRSAGAPDTDPMLRRELARIAEIDRWMESGPNVRAVDIPADVRLLDADAPLDPALLDRVDAVLDTLARQSPDVAERLREATAIVRDRLANGGVARTNDAVIQELFNAAERVPGMGKGLATEVLQRAGYDGIAHQGGRRVPMLDSTGAPIEHDVTVIFPDRLDRIRNAFSGEKGGAFLPGFDPASAAAGGAAGALSEGEDGEQGDPLRTAAGIGLGAFGARIARKPGHTVATGLKPGQRYEFRVRVVPLRELITSHLDNLAENPRFLGELQPRVRSRAASRVQIDKMVQAFDPEQVLMDTHRVDSGPMIVGPDMMVESGNGRAIALRRLSQENPEAYADYVQALREELPYYGLTDDALQGIDQPVLVRERVTPLDDAERARFASEANAPQAAQMSSMEQALADARNIGDGPLGRIVVGEDQTIDEALLSPENGAFVRAFMATVPDTERGKMLEANGNLSVTGLARVKAALLARTYPGTAGERVATAIVESTDAGLRNVQNAVMGSLPSMARVEGLIAAGDVDAGLSLADDIAAAVDVYARLKRAGILVGDYLQQAGMFGGRETTPLQDAILGYLNENARAPRRLRSLLEGYAREVEATAGSAGDMFGGPAPAATKEEVLDGVLRRLGAAPGADQGADVGRTGAAGNLVEGAAGRPIQVPGADSGAQAGRGAGGPSLLDDVAAAENLTPEQQIARLQAENDRLRAERRGGGRRQQPPQAAPLGDANLPPVGDDLIPPTGGPEGTLAREGAPEPPARPTPIPRDVLPPTGGEAGTLAQEGAPPAPARPLAEVVQDIVGDGRSRPVPVESPPGLNIRRLAKGIQLAAANPSPQIGLPGFPAPPPQASPNWWDLAQTWRYSMGLFGQLSTALVQGLGGVAEVGLGAPAELIRQAVVRGHPEHVPLIIGEALKSIPRGAKEFGTTAAGRVPETIMAGSDYRPPLSDQLTGSARTAARIIETPGRVATQAPDAFWYEVFYRTGLAQAAAEQATRKGASRLDPVGSYRMQQEMIANPTAEMMERAHEFARSSTYKGELGSVAKAIGKVFRGPENPTSGLAKAWKEVGSFLMPVYHTIARIHEGALEYVPGIGALPLEAAGLAARGRPLDQKIAQQAVGMAVAGSMLAYAAAGNVRGPGPTDSEKLKKMRDQGYEPNTTKVGDYWVPNAYFGRFGPILNTIGAMNDAIVYGDGSEQWNGARFDRQVRMVAKNFGRAFNDYPTAQAVSTLIKIKDDPVGALAEFAGGTAAQYVPAAYRSYATATDERVRRPERGKDVPPGQRFADTFAQRSGVGRQSLPEAQDVLGRPVENQRQGANVLFPRVGSDRPDRVIEAFQRGGVDIPKPADAFSIRNMVPESQRPPGSPSAFQVALTPQEQREWNTLRGQELIKQTNVLMARRGWAEKPLPQRQADLKLALEAAANAANAAMQSKLGAREVNERIRSGLQKKAS